MSEKILSQDEIDALLKGVATGEVETTPKDHSSQEGGIALFSFSGQDRVVRGRMAALDIIHNLFVRLLATTFSEALHRPVEVTVKNTEIVKYGSVLGRLPIPSSLIIFKLEPLRGSCLLAMDAPLVYLLTDRFFGGSGQTHVKAEGRDFTAIEQRIIRNIATLTLHDLDKAWKGVHPVKAEVNRIESNPQFAMIITATELANVLTLGLEIGDDQKEFFLCYPYSMLEPIKEKLQSGFINEQYEVDHHWAARLRDELQYCAAEVTVELGQATVQVEDLMGFGPGDVILLDKCYGDPVLAYVEGIPKFTGMPGVVKGQHALQVMSLVKSDN
jgi:flagellar motor switch protein FliM